ncbi:diguanylate cyclase domain-containing protein [Jeotgalibacillus proteolyticus]|uniref:PDC sensor domain-containing protein n=1 Tax=Jeotgalibacillus proteolyticus TaxID=2082395 RepID=UPI003CE9CF26
MSLTLRVYWGMVFAVFIVLFALFSSFIIVQIATDYLKEEKGKSLSGIAFQMTDKLDQYMWSRYSEVAILSSLEAVQSQSSIEEKRNLLNKVQQQIPSFSWMGISDNEGIIKASTGGMLEGQDISERPVFSEAREDVFVGDVHEALLLADLLPNPVGRKLEFVDISMPLKDEYGNFEGVLATHLSWEWAREVKSSIIDPLTSREKDDVEVFVISAEENRVILGPDSFIGRHLPLKSISKAKQDGNGWTIEEWNAGESYLTGYSQARGYREYPGIEWTVLVREPEETAFETAQDLSFVILISGILSAVFFSLIGWVIAGKIAKPLNKISSQAQLFSTGKNMHFPVYTGIKEIEDLSSSLQLMVKTLSTTESNLLKMEGMAYRDSLTGLPNRILLELSTSQMIREAKLDGEKLAFFYMDLDGFKQVNDTFGHHAGDLTLQHVAEILRSQVPDDAFVSRIGGDEFIILLPFSATGAEVPEKLALEIIQEINKPIPLDGAFATIGCSIGISLFPADENDFHTLISYADQALYHSKHKGKGRVTFYQSII